MAFFCNAGGYVGTLPKLGETIKPEDAPVNDNLKIFNKIAPSEPVKTDLNESSPPFAKKTFPDVYGGIIVKSSKYSKYIKDLNDIIPALDGLKDYIANNDRNLQFFSAKVHIYNLYIKDLKQKYGNKPEHYYESYKQMLAVNNDLTEAAYYWYKFDQYKKIYVVSAKENQKNEKLVKSKIDKALKSINIALEILKDSTKKGSY